MWELQKHKHPDYLLVKNIEPEKKEEKSRSSGGILFFCKKTIKKQVYIAIWQSILI